MQKIEYKKHFKQLYLPKDMPNIMDVPKMSFICVEGSGDPNGEEFSKNIEILYALSYAVKMSYKNKDVPADYYEYTVFPLEGVWDLVDKNLPHTNKYNLKYNIMIRQPDFLTDELFERFKAETEKKKPELNIGKAMFADIYEGLCVQMMHKGSYDAEPESFKIMEQFCKDNGYKRTDLTHREIYISDPRKTEESQRKTVLRFKISK
ncbi:MAG: GyrI-like domain-containing protein [Eubacteriaceae bacterium]